MKKNVKNIFASAQADAIASHLAAQLPAHLRILRRMVGINSFTENQRGVNRLGDYTASCFEPLGFSSKFIQSANPKFGKHLFLRRKGRGRGAVCMLSHLDTVFPPVEERLHDFRWHPEGGRIYGPGTVDDKGGTLGILMTLSGIRRFFPEIFEEITWEIAIDASEEHLSSDFSELCASRLENLRTLACLVFESGAFNDNVFTLVSARKGRAVFKVSVSGRGAHAGASHGQGANAIVQLSRIVDRISALNDYQRGLTFNVGLISGGSAINRVPHHAEAELEMRAFSPEVFRSGQSALLSLADEAATVHSHEDGFSCRVRIETLYETSPWPWNPGTESLLQVWRSTAEDMGASIKAEERGGLSDGNALHSRFPTLDGLGPGGGNGHCSENSTDGSKKPEYLDLSSIVPKACLNVLAIARLAKEMQAREPGLFHK
ncbi:MAG: hypothetical protein A2X49_12030 [Lentisphaerae bacterium GWF2_52_8]|nr:MAG: hypothetical protein A2X49_12030 [Lentisphaerae bacterium GWF2_52_8]